METRGGLPIRSTTFKLNVGTDPTNKGALNIDLTGAAEGKKLLIKCSGHASSGGSSWPWDSVAGGVAHGLDGDAKECVLDAYDATTKSRVVEIAHKKSAEVAFVGITFANGVTTGSGAGIFTPPDNVDGRLKLITNFCKLLKNVAVCTRVCMHRLLSA
jgi:hypothetical protein